MGIKDGKARSREGAARWEGEGGKERKEGAAEIQKGRILAAAHETEK
jgi:hypothetical protein